MGKAIKDLQLFPVYPDARLVFLATEVRKVHNAYSCYTCTGRGSYTEIDELASSTNSVEPVSYRVHVAKMHAWSRLLTAFNDIHAI